MLDPPFSRSSKLRQIELSSAAIQRLTLCGISHLETIILDCPVLTSLDLSCCHLLEESVLANFGDASKQHDIPGFVSGRPALRPKCPSLRCAQRPKQILYKDVFQLSVVTCTDGVECSSPEEVICQEGSICYILA